MPTVTTYKLAKIIVHYIDLQD